ncbi:putative tetratricopeptide-like helical domain superfamily [Helianthus anomalus]
MIISHLRAFIIFKGDSFLLPSQNPLSSSRLGLHFSPHATLLASLLHSNSFSNNGDPPLSRYQKLTNLDHAFNLFDEMTQRRPLPSVVKFNQLLNAVTKMKHFSSCLHLFKHMCVIGVPVNEYSISIAIKCCCRMSRTNDGFALLASCFRRAVVPNVYIFSTLLDGLVIEDRILEAEIFFKKLIKQRLCEPDVVMYSTMIKGLCKVGNNDNAIGLLRLMEERGCKPNVVVYSTIVDSLCKDKMIDDAFKLFKEMVFHKGIPTNVITYNSLIHGLCNLCRWDEVSKLLKEMEDLRISPSLRTFSILVDALCKEGKVDEAEAIIDIMVERRVVPDIVTYNTLIDGYCLRGEMTKARTLFDSLRVWHGPHPTTPSLSYTPSLSPAPSLSLFFLASANLHRFQVFAATYVGRRRCLPRGKLLCRSIAAPTPYPLTSKGLVPDVFTYSSLLNGYCKSLKIEEAMHLFHEITRKGLKPDIVSYSAMLQGLFRVGRCGAARKFFDEMQAQGLIPDECTYGIILDGLCNNHQLEEALSLFHLVGDSKLNSNIVVYTILIEGASKCGKLDIARDLFQDLTLKGLQPNVRTYTVMVSGLCGEGLLKEAKHLFRKMGESGCPPDGVTYNVLLQGYFKNQNYDDVEMLLQEMDGRRYSLDASTLGYTVWLRDGGGKAFCRAANTAADQVWSRQNKHLGDPMPTREEEREKGGGGALQRSYDRLK